MSPSQHFSEMEKHCFKEARELRRRYNQEEEEGTGDDVEMPEEAPSHAASEAKDSVDEAQDVAAAEAGAARADAEAE